MAEREQVTNSNIVYEGPIFSVEKQEVKLYNGRQSQRDIVRHVPAIAVLPFVDADHMMIEKQYRATIGDFILEIPAGKLDERDLAVPEHAVERELNEELRMTAGTIERVMGFFETVGFSDAYMHVYVARDLKPIPLSKQLPRDLGESLDLITISFDEMKTLFESGKINDQKTVLAFLYWSYLRG
ncbi:MULTISPECIES: NUDIX hydrolase [Leuconostoc]|uniref:ADP-ribose pyrophosphatase n=2 Tax=Leuconostoc kimchii TaxID=136609 RepID=D5T5K1_LEUKI|nr:MULTISPECIES: NUDIX hydrolase [Leuconostoc]ADG41331.1 ADP-ribose pyrophosphatase [Leuconostoc kimchii IMSNU 11154]AEJ30689.1 ADP-ribose pyrophosphatase [Leuconostoc sp. C2]QBR47816.1 NUDIX hydrolase [Leuconostoc kimchii]